MGFEYVFAYLENLEWVFIIGLIISSLWLLIGLILRIGNEMDKDDWILFMGAGGIFFAFFLLMASSPSIEHINKVRSSLITVNQIKEIPNEPIYYPAGTGCNSVSLCKGQVSKGQ